MTKRSRLFVFIGVSIPVILAFICIYGIHLITAEGRFYPKTGSVAYYLVLSSTIREFPIVSLANKPEYYSESGDGPAPAIEGVNYETSESKEKIIPIILIYLKQKGFHETNEDAEYGRVYRNGNTELQFSVYDWNNKTKVAVEAMHF